MTYRQLWQRLVPVYGKGEAQAIARLIYEVRYGLTLSDLLMGRDSSVPQDELEQIAIRLERQEPVQYILGQADFCGRTFMVNKHVLIPRPETEELCQWILTTDATNILDIGTGSGCIAITLALDIPNSQVTAWDISADALAVARENARRHNVHVSFEQVDALHLTSDICHQTSDVFDLIVSNPPYICNKERVAMETNVLEHEPHTALFVPDDDPLLFYRAIAQYGQTALKEGGWLYFEINPLYAESLQDMLSKMSYHDITLNNDQYGKQRMIRAKR